MTILLRKTVNPEVLFMDEPTIFLDYVNKYYFRDRMLEFGSKYGNRIQFIIPTNDGVLIDGCKGNCKYISFYKTPVETCEKIDLVS